MIFEFKKIYEYFKNCVKLQLARLSVKKKFLPGYLEVL